MVDALEGVARSIEAGEATICPGEFGREAMEIAIALRESHRRGNVRIDLPLEDRSLKLIPQKGRFTPGKGRYWSRCQTVYGSQQHRNQTTMY